MDSNNDGVISKEELRETLRQDGFLITEVEFEQCWKYLDRNGRDEIDVERFDLFLSKAKRTVTTQTWDKLLASPSFFASCCYLGSAFAPFLTNERNVARIQKFLFPL